MIGQLLRKESTELDHLIDYYRGVYEIKEELESFEAKQIINKSLVVAMTTTGRAKYSAMLGNVNFPIIIVEEAAEVFEAHITTSLSKNT